MKLKFIFMLATIEATLAWQAGAQTYDTNNVFVQTFAGSGFSGYVDGVGQLTMFNNPSRVVADSSGNLFVLDSGNERIRKVTPDGTVSTFAGGGTQAEGYGTNVKFQGLLGAMTIDHSNTLLAGALGSSISISFDLCRIHNDGYVSRTNLTGFDPNSGLCVDSANNVYYSDQQGNKIYRFKTNGVLEVFAGSGNLGSADGNGIFTSFYHPTQLAADAADNIYVWDVENHLIRRISQNRDVVTIAGKLEISSNSDGVGTNATFNSITAMIVDNNGNIIMACGSSIRKMDAATKVLTVAGSFSGGGYTNGAGNLARFNGASGVCISGGTIYVADSSNQRIRSITNNPTIQPVVPANLQLSTYAGLQITGTVGRTYQVQSSPDMSTWTTRATLLLTSSPYLWFDQNPVSGNKFYRAVLLP